MALVLTIDDSLQTRATVRLTLERRGHLTIEASDGITGVMTAAVEQPDVIIAADHLPALSGERLVRALSDAAPEARIFVVARGLTPETREAFEAAGTVGFLSRPLQGGEVRTVLGLGSSGRSPQAAC